MSWETYFLKAYLMTGFIASVLAPRLVLDSDLTVARQGVHEFIIIIVYFRHRVHRNYNKTT